MKFQVRVQKADGTEEERVLEAESRFDVYNDLAKEGSTALLLVAKPPQLDLSKYFSVSFGTSVKTEERITFTKNLSAMLAAGLPLSRALTVIEKQTRNKSFKKVITHLNETVRAGSSLHEGLETHKKIFSKLFIAMTKAGEESGTLADALGVVAHQMDSAYSLEKKVKGAMIYPAVILFAIVVIGILMLMYVVPTLSETFKSLGAELPLMTRIIIDASDFTAKNGVVVFGGLVLFVIGAVVAFRSKLVKPLILATSLRMAGIGDIVRETFAARAARSLASLLSSGVQMLTAIEIAAEVVGENAFGRVIKEAGARVKKGEAFSSAFVEHSSLYPSFIGDMIAVGEETGKVADMLSQVATYYETSVEDRTKNLSTIIEPLLMLVIGAVVGVFAVAMISPIYSLSSQI